MQENTLHELMDVAERKRPADLVIRNIGLLNMFTETIENCDVSVVRGRIGRVAIADYDVDIPANKTIDGSRKFLLPGFIDAHTHIEMSFLSPMSFSSVVLPQGTTSVIADMHDVCNVGLDSMRHHALESDAAPLKIHLMVPPCVPATPKLEDAGTDMTLDSLRESLELPSVYGVGETMDLGRIFDREPHLLSMLSWANSQGLKIDGHAPAMMGDKLQAYLVTGISSDHESCSLKEMLEKYRLGMKVILRRGSLKEPVSARDLIDSLADNANVLLSTDGCVFLEDLIDKGGMLEAVRQVISEGVDPLIAVKLATYNVARAYHFDHKIGVIAPGRAADMIIVDDLATINIVDVYLDGEPVLQTEDSDLERYEYPTDILQTVKMDPVKPEMFEIVTPNTQADVDVRVMKLLEGTVLTKSEIHRMKIQDGLLSVDPSRDLLKIAVFDRYKAGGKHALGIVKGFGFKNCAYGGTIGQDSQNLVVVGSNDSDMALVVNTLREMQGGVAIVSNDEVKATFSLPISGIMSPLKPIEVREELDQLHECLKSYGGTLENPSFNLSLLLTCAVIPELKITNQGLVDVQSSEFVPLLVY